VRKLASKKGKVYKAHFGKVLKTIKASERGRRIEKRGKKRGETKNGTWDACWTQCKKQNTAL